MKKELVFLSSIMEDIRYYQRHSYLGDKLKELLDELEACSDFKNEQELGQWLLETRQVSESSDLFFFENRVEWVKESDHLIESIHLPKLKNDFEPEVVKTDGLIKVTSKEGHAGEMYLTYENRVLEFVELKD